jgi:hypothetical protein
MSPTSQNPVAAMLSADLNLRNFPAGCFMTLDVWAQPGLNDEWTDGQKLMICQPGEAKSKEQQHEPGLKVK